MRFFILLITFSLSLSLLSGCKIKQLAEGNLTFYIDDADAEKKAQQEATDLQKNKAKIVVPKWVEEGLTDDSLYFNEVIILPAYSLTTVNEDRAKKMAIENMNRRLQKAFHQNYTDRLRDEMQDFGDLEIKIRNAARTQLESVKIVDAEEHNRYFYEKKEKTYFWFRVSKEKIDKEISDRLVVLDNQLRDYVHMSDKGRNLIQFLSIIPALPTIEERKMLKIQLETTWNRKVPLPNDGLVKLMNRQINKLIDNMIFSLEASTDESEVYEHAYRKALSDEGLNMTSRIPDLVLQYYIEPEDDTVKENGLFKVALTGDIEMIDSDSNAFTHVSDSFQGMRRFESDAENEAVSEVAKRTADAIVLKMIDYMNDVNRLNYQR